MNGAGERRKVWYLRRIDLFAGMSKAEVEEIARLLDDHHLPAGAELLRDRRRERVYIIKAGAVRLYAGEGPGEVTLALLGPGRLFGLSTTVGDASPALGAATLEPSYVCFATWGKLLEVFAHHPRVMLQLVGTLAEQVFHAETWIERRAAASPRARLAGLLLELSAEFGEPAEDGAGRRIRFRLTQADLARMIGVSRETVSRLLAEFGRAGWVARREGLLIVRDMAALRAAGEGRQAAD